MACHAHGNDYVLMAETPAMYASSSVTQFIRQEISRPSKQWITNIIDGKQESDEVIRRTHSYVLLPDTERMNRYWRTGANNARHANNRAYPRRMLNWLAISLDKHIHSLRDLRGAHLQTLKDMLHDSMQAIETETGIRANQVMAYVHYPPSVYQLHVHFSYPYGQFCHRDAYRVHNLASVINNLEIDPEYYAKATLHMAVMPQSSHCAALSEAKRLAEGGAEPNTADEKA